MRASTYIVPVVIVFAVPITFWLMSITGVLVIPTYPGAGRIVVQPFRSVVESR